MTTITVNQVSSYPNKNPSKSISASFNSGFFLLICIALIESPPNLPVRIPLCKIIPEDPKGMLFSLSFGVSDSILQL